MYVMHLSETLKFLPYYCLILHYLKVSLREMLQLALSNLTDKYQSQILSIIPNGNLGYNVNTDFVKVDNSNKGGYVSPKA